MLAAGTGGGPLKVEREAIRGNVSWWSVVTDSGHHLRMKIVMAPERGHFLMNSGARIRYGHGVGPGCKAEDVGRFKHILYVQPLDDPWSYNRRAEVAPWLDSQVAEDELLIGWSWRAPKISKSRDDPAQLSLLGGE